MHKYRSTAIIAVLALAAIAASAQTMTNSTSTNISSSTNVSNSTTTSSSTTVTSGSDTRVRSEADYVAWAGPRFERLAGSRRNVRALVHGLRTGSEVTLTGRGESATFTPGPGTMSFSSITRTLELAQRQLANAGKRQPTPRELAATLNGGTIATANGERSMPGILRLRSQGMNWNQIAQHVGVESRSVHTRGGANTSVTSSSVTTSAGGNVQTGVPQGASAGGASVTFGQGGMRVQAGDAKVETGR